MRRKKLNHRTSSGKLKRHFFAGPDFSFEEDAHLEHPPGYDWDLWYLLYDYLRHPERLAQYSGELAQIVQGWITKLKKDPLYPNNGFTLVLLAGPTLTISALPGTNYQFTRAQRRKMHVVKSIPELLRGARTGYPDAMLPYHFGHRRFSRTNVLRIIRRTKGDLKSLSGQLGVSGKHLRYVLQELMLTEELHLTRKKANRPPLDWDPQYIDLPQFYLIIEVQQNQFSTSEK